MYLTFIKGILSVIGISKAVLTRKVRLGGRFLSPQLFHLLYFQINFQNMPPFCLSSLSATVCLIPTALTACFVKDEVI